MHLRAFVGSLAHPAYTGQARDPGFVVANVLVVSLLAVAAESLAPLAGSVLIVVGLALLVARGYAVPGTPWLLRTVERRVDALATSGPERLPRDERELLRAGVFAVRGDEFRPTESFAAAWRSRVVTAGRREDDSRSLAVALGLPPDAVRLVPVGEVLVAESRGRRFGAWLSRAALVADTASIAELRRRCPQWDLLPPRLRGAMLATLRLYLDVCPVCDGGLSLDRAASRVPGAADTVVAVTCTGCDARLFESGFAASVAAVDDDDTSPSVVGH